jgi:hypothetical protein
MQRQMQMQRTVVWEEGLLSQATRLSGLQI